MILDCTREKTAIPKTLEDWRAYEGMLVRIRTRTTKAWITGVRLIRVIAPDKCEVLLPHHGGHTEIESLDRLAPWVKGAAEQEAVRAKRGFPTRVADDMDDTAPTVIWSNADQGFLGGINLRGTKPGSGDSLFELTKCANCKHPFDTATIMGRLQAQHVYSQARKWDLCDAGCTLMPIHVARQRWDDVVSQRERERAAKQLAEAQAKAAPAPVPVEPPPASVAPPVPEAVSKPVEAPAAISAPAPAPKPERAPARRESKLDGVIQAMRDEAAAWALYLEARGRRRTAQMERDIAAMSARADEVPERAAEVYRAPAPVAPAAPAALPVVAKGKSKGMADHRRRTRAPRPPLGLAMYERIDAQGTSLSKLATVMDVWHSDLSQLGVGRRKMTQHWARLFAKHLGETEHFWMSFAPKK